MTTPQQDTLPDPVEPPADYDEVTEAERRLRDQADRGYPDAWMPENDGDEIVGVLREVRSAPSKFGQKPVLVLANPRDGSEWSVWLHHAVLRSQIYRAKPQLGELLLIRYVGRVAPEGGGNSYADYRVVVDRPAETSVNWRELLGDEIGDEPPPQQPDDADDIPF